MAAMTGSYHPESLDFNKHQRFSDPEDGGALNEVVRSKPIAYTSSSSTSHRPFINNENAPSSASSCESRERQDRSSTGVGDRGYNNYVSSPSSSLISSSSQKTPQHTNMVTGTHTINKPGGSKVTEGRHFVPPNGSIPVVSTVSLNAKGTLASDSEKKSGHDSLTSNDLLKLDLGTLEGDSQGDADDDTEALLSIEREGRPSSIYLGPSTGDMIEGSSGCLEDTLVMGHKKCAVTLEQESITWRFLSRKERGGKPQHLYLSDIYAVVQGAHSQLAHTPLTPHSPAHRPNPLASATPTHSPSSSPSSSSVSHSQSQTNQHHHSRRLQRNSSSSSVSGGAGCYFTLHALKSQPGTVGSLVRVTFRCQTPETAEMWVEQINHEMQNFGNRPRKLYIVINPFSGASASSNSKTWVKIQKMFQAANIHTDVLTTQHRFHAREEIQTLELSQYDGIISVGGDGLFNEVLNGLLIQTQNQSGVNLRRSRFIPVTPSIRLGVIPTGFNNTICRSIFNCKSPMVAAAQILLGCSSPVDVCSVSQNSTLLLFSAGPMSYGFWSDTALSSRDFSWMGSRRFDCATLRTLLTHQHFEAEIQFVPIEDPDEIITKKEKCYNRCQKCSNFDNLDSSSGASEKGASLMAAYNEIDRDDKSKWKTITGQFSSVVSCLHTCCGVQAPHGISPYGHVGNGCTDLIMLTRCSTLDHAKWIFKQRKKSSTQFDHPYLHIRRVKEFRFREILRPVSIVHGGGARGGASSTRSSADPDDIDVNSVDNLVVPDDDEITNSKAGARSQGGRKAQSGGRGSSSSSSMVTSQWNIDGDELPRANIEVRVHRHLVSVFGRGIEPPDTSSDATRVTMDDDDSQHDDLIT